jgi:hypothetical protein
MKSRYLVLAVLALSHCAVRQANAGVVYYTNQAAFEAAAPGVATQTFGFLDGTLGAGGFDGVPAPVDTATSNAYISPGDILPGVSITTRPGLDSYDVLVAGSGAVGNTNPLIGANYFVATLDLNFAPSVTAVGLGLLSLLDGGDFTLSFYSPSNTLIGQATVLGVPNSGIGKFFGFVSTGGEAVGSVNISSNSGQVEAIDLLQFGQADVSPNPEPTSLALLGTAAISLTGYYGWRRRKQAVTA